MTTSSTYSSQRHPFRRSTQLHEETALHSSHYSRSLWFLYSCLNSQAKRVYFDIQVVLLLFNDTEEIQWFLVAFLVFWTTYVIIHLDGSVFDRSAVALQETSYFGPRMIIIGPLDAFLDVLKPQCKEFQHSDSLAPQYDNADSTTTTEASFYDWGQLVLKWGGGYKWFLQLSFTFFMFLWVLWHQWPPHIQLHIFAFSSTTFRHLPPSI